MSGIRWLRLCLVAVWVPVIAGCNPFSEARSMMDEYVERVARVLDAEPVLTPIEPPEQMPRRRDRVLPMPELDIGLLDFLSLYGCELQFVVGEKNSVMGRVMQPLNRLRYEVRFIQTARQCRPEITDEALAEALDGAIASKLDSLPIAIWNATWGTEEIETLFTLAKGYYPVAPVENPLSDLARDAERLNQVVASLRAQRLAVSLDFAGSVHQRWQAQYRAGQLIQSARLLATRLDDATALLRQRVDGRPLCFNGKSNSRSELVRSMFFSVYIDRIQPYIASVARAQDQLIAPLARLAEQQVDVMPAAFARWSQVYLATDASGSVWAALDRAINAHTRAWQALLMQCGLQPGR